MASRAKEQFLNALLPIACCACQAEGEWLCRDCRASLLESRPIICVLCAKAAENGLCQRCQIQTGLTGAVSLFHYRQPGIQQLIKRLKFAGHTDIARFFIEVYGEQLIERLSDEAGTLVPIPLSQERLRQRGFNQATMIAEWLARQYGFKIWTGLVRTRHTAAQAELDKSARLKNIRGAFARRDDGPVPTVTLLVDDVITTGATMTAAAKVLRKAGAITIWALTLAHG